MFATNIFYMSEIKQKKYFPIENRFSGYLFLPCEMRAYFRITSVMRKKNSSHMCTQLDKEGRMAGGKQDL